MSRTEDRCPPMLAPLLSRLIDSRLTPEDRDKLQDLLRHDADCRRYYRCFMQVHAEMQWSMGQARPERDAPFIGVVENEPEPDVDAFLSLLTGSDGRSKEPAPIHIASSNPLTRKAYASALSYVIKHTFTPKRITVLAAAAALLVGVVLAIVFLTGDDEAPSMTGLPDRPNEAPKQSAIAPVLATITDLSDAHWRLGDADVVMPVGSSLQQSERLTLAKGYAEITTSRGAVLLLHAPCTIEMQDAENTVRLHGGKLVGRCETPSSKGFTVSTPGAQIIDVGTVFGVDVNEQGETLAHVFQGEIEVRSGTDTAAGTVRLVTNEAIVVDSAGAAELVDASPQRFARVVPKTKYQAAVIASGPMCYWRGPIQEDTRLVLDNGWLGAHGQASEFLQNNPSGYAAEDASGALGYPADEPTSSVTVPYRDEFGFKNGFSVSAWCWIEPGHPDVMRILSTRVEGGGIGLGVIGRGDKATGGLPASAPILTLFGQSDVVATQSMPEGRWSHLTVTVSDAGQVHIYIDGKEVPTRTIQHAEDQLQGGDTDIQPLMIGRNPFTGQGVQAWQGRLDEIAIFDRILDEKEIQAHLNTTTQAP